MLLIVTLSRNAESSSKADAMTLRRVFVVEVSLCRTYTKAWLDRMPVK